MKLERSSLIAQSRFTNRSDQDCYDRTHEQAREKAAAQVNEWSRFITFCEPTIENSIIR